jgi:hypothetical protein
MNVGVVRESLSPGMQDRGEADLSAEVFGISGKRFERLRRGFE